MKIRWDNSAFGQLLKGPEVTRLVAERTEAAAAAAGDGFGHVMHTAGTRPRGVLWTITWKAKKEQARDAVLQRAVGGRA